MDSLDMVELVMEAEKEFGISFPDEEVARLRHATAGEAWRLAVALQTGTAPTGRPSAADPTWQRLRALLSRVLDVPVDDISPERRLDA
jgi:acyl carrier protein